MPTSSSAPPSRSTPTGRLNARETVERQRLEDVIETAATWDLLEVEALLAIRRNRLYRSSHDSFEKYVEDRWRTSRAHANRLCSWAEVVENLSPVGDGHPVREYHARPLYGLTPAQQRRAWRQHRLSAPLTLRQARWVARRFGHRRIDVPRVMYFGPATYQKSPFPLRGTLRKQRCPAVKDHVEPSFQPQGARFCLRNLREITPLALGGHSRLR